MDEWAWAEDLTADEIREECPEPERVVSARYWHRMSAGFRDSRFHGIVARYGDPPPHFAVRLDGDWSWQDADGAAAAIERFLETR